MRFNSPYLRVAAVVHDFEKQCGVRVQPHDFEKFSFEFEDFIGELDT
jgi:hypothetical protein